MPKMDYTELLKRIRDRGLTQKAVAERVGISEGQFCQKLAGRYAFKQSEIEKICGLLDISSNNIGAYFFTPCS